MVLGYRGRAEWRDMSDFLVHLTDSRESFISIVREDSIAAAPLGAVKGHPALDRLPSQKSCCLSEIPLDYLDRLTDRHGLYGLGFSKQFIQGVGGVRVWYLDKGVETADALFESIRRDWYADPDETSLIWKLTPFIDYVMPNHEFEWEREWRVVDGLSNFIDDVIFIFAPEEEHGLLIGALGHRAVALDARWPEQRLQQAIAQLPVV
jgi:hypothetical protein